MRTTKTPKNKKIKATAIGACFSIEITAKITPTEALSREEIDTLARKLKHQLTKNISSLPYAHIYPFEVSVQ